MTKVYIDITQFMQINALTGIQRVMRELMVRMLKSDELETILIFYDHQARKYRLVDREKMLRYLDQNWGRKLDTYATVQIEIEDLEPGSVFFEIDVAWSAKLKRSYLLPLLKKQGLILVSMIYDIMAITHYQYFHPYFTFEFMEFIGAHVRYDDLIIVNTHPSEQYLIDFSRELGVSHIRTEVVPLGGDFQGQDNSPSSPDDVQEKIRRIADRKKYILLVGTLEPRKNHTLVYEAFRKEGLCNENINVIFAGRTGWIEKGFLKKLYADKDFGRRIYHIKDATNADLNYLYHHAFVVAFPTHMEGYGLPVVEALQNGAVTVVSDIDVLREVGGDACVYFRQNSAKDFAEKVSALMRNPKEYQRLRNLAAAYSPFTWDEATEKVIQALTKAKEEK